jgi:D-alanine-D-alanine ligase
MRVGLVFGGRSVEHDVSVQSARTVAEGLRGAGHEVVPLGIGSDGTWTTQELGSEALAGGRDRLPPGDGARSVLESLDRLAHARVDALFLIAHGTWGEDGTLQGLAEMADLPYTGAGVAASAVAMDKVLAKSCLQAAGIPVVESITVTGHAFAADPDAALAGAEDLGTPLFVKPAVGGSSVGVRRVGDLSELADAVAFALRFDDRVLVERGVTGRELECAVLGDLQLEYSPIGEIVPGKEFYDYEDKYQSDTAQLIAPAELPDGLAERLGETAVEAFAALGGHGMARVDFLVEGDGPDATAYVNEINTLPGFTRISMYPRLWGLAGVPLPELTDRLVEIAVARHRRRKRLDEGIRDWISELEGR